ncbi:hypothetical protein BIW11_06165 [Tropilaelaps mercedesae]|uniref:Cuticle protein 10.9-like n=1 Tax=Tropilaelaps mercedesae TaxID=418985 RepID=A0A1V9XZ95_9ACAR|nr:hypothetical protein BIW11_06165 [Tropilaelaps mercedesae]
MAKNPELIDYNNNSPTQVFMTCALIAHALARSNDGFSSTSQSEDDYGGYRYEYDITDWDTNRKRWEQTDADNNRRGGYQIVDVDGQVRQVEYQADKDGFRATIRTNEPGTQPGEVGGAVFTNDVGDIIQNTRGILQNTGHIQKQKKLGYYPDNVPAAPIHPVVPGAQVIKHHAGQGSHFDSVSPVSPSRPFTVDGPSSSAGPSLTANKGSGSVGPSFNAVGLSGQKEPLFTARAPNGSNNSSFTSHGGFGPIGPSFSAQVPSGPRSVSGSGFRGPSFTSHDGSGPGGPSFTSHGSSVPVGPSFTQSDGPIGPTFTAYGAKGPVGPSFTATQGDGPVGPTFVSHGGKGPVGPSFTASEGGGPVGPTFVSHGGKGPIGPSFRATEGDGPVGPTFVHHGGSGSVGPRFTAQGPSGLNDPSFTSHGPRGPTGPSFTWHGSSGSSGSSFNSRGFSAPSGPSLSSHRSSRPSSPTFVSRGPSGLSTPSGPLFTSFDNTKIMSSKRGNDVPSYTGPIRRPQKPIHDPSQQFEVPAAPLTPSRVPAYTPATDNEWNGPTVPPPASRQRTAYQPIGRASAASNVQPIVVKFNGESSFKGRSFSWTEGTNRNSVSW